MLLVDQSTDILFAACHQFNDLALCCARITEKIMARLLL